MNKLFLTCTALLAFCAYNAQAAESATGTAVVEVVQAVDITHNSNDKLSFGSVYAKAGNTVTIGQNGSKTAGDAFGTFSADKFTISGPNGASVTLGMPTSATMTKGSDTIVATLDPSKANGATINLTGTDVVINVGGTINVNANTPTGSYTGNYNVTISY